MAPERKGAGLTDCWAATAVNPAVGKLSQSYHSVAFGEQAFKAVIRPKYILLNNN